MNKSGMLPIGVFDLRLEKSLDLVHGAQLRLFLDGFNIANAYAAETISTTTGPNFQRPTSILPPRTGKIGFRLSW